jgi:polyhydroxybutyrate depolymerase
MESIFESCNSSDPIPVFEIHGTADPITHWEGDPYYSEEYGGYLSVVETFDFWVKKNSCTQSKIDTLQDSNSADSSFVVTEKYTGGVSNHEVWLYSLVGGKHDWPGTWGNKDIITSEEIWNFFKLFVKNSSQ